MASPLRLGVAGLGTVGTGLVKLLDAHGERISASVGRPVEIRAVSARTKGRDRGIDTDRFLWVDDPVALATHDEIDCYVELIGGEEGAARASVEAALKAGKSVVTANKALLAHHGTALARLAEENGVALKFEAAVAGGIPVIKAMRESLQGNDVRRVYGILNGTCNYILTLMLDEARAFQDVLGEAQEKGYAEADPTFDIGGFDAAHKLALLTSLAFGTEVSIDDVYVEGIEGVTLEDMRAADELGYRVKLLGVAVKTDAGIEQRVHPTMLPKTSAVAGVNGVTNCVAIDGDQVGQVVLVGPGAGGSATASSVAGDIIDVARGDTSPAFVRKASDLTKPHRALMRSHEGAYYVRLDVHDRLGAFAAIASHMAERQVSLESIVQRRSESGLPGLLPPGQPGDLASVVLITHRTTEQAIREALAAIEADGHLAGRPQMIRIEDY